MSRFWHDIRVHRTAAILYLVYWITTLAVVPVTWNRGIPLPVVLLLFTNSLVAGALITRWRARSGEANDRKQSIPGTLAGVMIAVITFVVMKGGVIDEFLGWASGNRFEPFELLDFLIATVIFGAILGWTGAALAQLANRLIRQVAQPN